MRTPGVFHAARIAVVPALLLACALPTGAAPLGTALVAAATSLSATVRGIVTVGMTVGNMERSLDFYTRVLDFQKVSDVELAGAELERLQGVFGLRVRVCRIQLGAETLELTEYLAPQGRPVPIDSRSNDRWFQHVAIIVCDMDKAYARLREHRVRHASSGPQTLPDWNPDAGGIRAFYFKDPDDHVLEILQFPEDKGDPRWHKPTDRLFLGIDHTAIVVQDTERSIGFYRGALGMAIAGGAENHGTEQEHLNNVFGARLRITALRSRSGPAIELIEYLAPRDGRPSPPDSRANDLWHWQVTVDCADLAAAEATVRTPGVSFVSPGLVDLPDDAVGFRRGLLIRDPDGHAIRLVSAGDPQR